MKALVTGGGGFLGGAVVRLLRQRGDSVRSFTRSRYPWLDELGVEQIARRPREPRRRRAGRRPGATSCSTSRRRPACGAGTPTSSTPT